MEKSRIEWKNHFIELIVVFIGITLAFMLNSWREESKSHKLESQYISSFYDEIVYDGARLDTIINANNNKINKFSSVINQLKTGDLSLDTCLVVAGEMAQINLFIPKTNTYETIKNSGNFNIINDYELRSKLIEYYESFEGKKLTEEYYKMYINNFIIPFLFENLDLVNSAIIAEKDFNNHKFNNLIVGYYQLLVQVVNSYEKISELNRELKLIISDEFKSPGK
jgi:hypothetical protein